MLMLGGGILMVLASLLNWGGNMSGVNTDVLGLLGIFTLLFGLAIAAEAGLKAFSPNTKLPTEVGGVDLDKISVILGMTVFLWTFGMITRDGTQIGLHLAWISGAIVAAGGILAIQDDDSATSSI
jgi:hypothetical protein